MAARRDKTSLPIVALLTLVCSVDVSVAAEDQTKLQLDVTINGISSGMIGSFVLIDGKRIGATRNELEDVGLDVGTRRFSDDIVILDDIPKLTYIYDSRTQSISIKVDDARRRGHVFDVSGMNRPPATPKSDWGVLLNYDLFGSEDFSGGFSKLGTPGTELSLDARAFSPYGTLEQSANIADGSSSAAKAVRLNSTYQVSDAERLTTYQAGDIITGGLENSRPIRIAGFQAQSNFSLRPDLVTVPLPSFSGVATVPSTVDLFINNTKAYSQEVPPGPFTLANIPVVSGAGNAQLVLTDPSGHQSKTTMPFFASSTLLATGLTGWSVETGVPRLSFGSQAMDYSPTPVASATLRHGFSDWLTAEGHAEGGAGIVTAGLGAAVAAGGLGVATAYLSASGWSKNTGFQASAAFETEIFGINFNASVLQSFGDYTDLAAATARVEGQFPAQSEKALIVSVRPAKALDRLSIGAPLPFDRQSTLSASFIHVRDSGEDRSDILTASYSRTLPFSASLSGTTFYDFADRHNLGIFVGLSVPLNDGVSLSSSYSSSGGKGIMTASAGRSLGPVPGSYGWSVEDSEGASRYHVAQASYRSSYGTIQAAAAAGASTTGTLELRGSIATMGGDVFFSDWIDDGLGVVDVGAPGVGVLQDNQTVGVTNAKGLLLVPTLRSFERNAIAIDPSNLPVDTEVERVESVAVPADRGGVLLNFKVKRDARSALVIFRQADGSFVPAGASGRIGKDNEFVVGYDGEAFITNLDATNQARIETSDETCSARFDFTPIAGQQVRIGPIVCQKNEPAAGGADASSALQGPERRGSN